MTPPVLYAPYFGGTDYARLARVLAYTAHQQCPGWTIRVEHASPPLRIGGQNDSHRTNTQKMDCWLQVLDQAQPGDRILFLDVDTCILRPVDDLWEQPFDLAYTIKPGAHPPFNTGVVAVRVSDRIRRFFAEWHAEQLRMLEDGLYHHPYQRRYGGIHQAALGALLERRDALDSPVSGCQILGLLCREWNCENSAWLDYQPGRTRIVHVKDKLRKAVFKQQKPEPALYPYRLVLTWRQLEEQAASPRHQEDVTHVSRREGTAHV